MITNYKHVSSTSEYCEYYYYVCRCLPHSLFSFESSAGLLLAVTDFFVCVYPTPCGLKAGGLGAVGLPTPLISTASDSSEASIGVLGSFKLEADCLKPAGVTSKAGPGKSRGATSFGFPLFKSK